MIWVLILFVVFQLFLAFLVGYLIFLTAASWQFPRSTVPFQTRAFRRFLILIPAHNEEQLLPDLLESLDKLDYPKKLYSVHVVADNCTDQTAAVATKENVTVHVRDDCGHIGKGYALNWLIDRLSQAGKLHDAVVFFDADSIVSANFLQVISAHLERGERAIQSYYAVRDPDVSWAGSLRYAAFAVLHYLRPLGRMHLGTSAGLKGNGMTFSNDLLNRYSWSSSMTEDIELHMTLLLSGERVTFAPEAVVWAEMPDNLTNSASQHLRWEQGKKQMARKYVPKLLAAALQKLRRGYFRQTFVLLDAVMEFIEPPFSVLFGVNLLSLVISVVMMVGISATPLWIPSGWPVRLAAFNALLALILLIGQCVYLFSGLRLVSAPKQVYLNLLFAPRLVIWKIWQMVLVLLEKDQNTWIRTKRNQG